MPLTEKFQIGVVVSPHGLKGECKVFPTTDDRKRFRTLKKVFLENDKGEAQELHVASTKDAGKFVILKCDEFQDISQVERLHGCSLWVAREDAIPLEEGEYYAADLIGLSVYDEEGVLVGTLKAVLETYANDVYEVSLPGGEKEVLLPAIKDCIKEIDLGASRMTIHRMEGLFDD